ncbi:MAG: hotdog fold thioesterase [Syntrophobacterales bacterium]|nr:MAG: hotdog fold thioesterase [Syntrophobacterales bacterium]
MIKKVFDALSKRVDWEPYAQLMGLKLKKVDKGYSLVEMTITEEMQNILGSAHGGAIFSLIDEAFETASNSHGTIAVALNMNVTFIVPPSPGAVLQAEAKEINLTPRTATYLINVTEGENRLVATCQALVYRKKDILPFLEEGPSLGKRKGWGRGN